MLFGENEKFKFLKNNITYEIFLNITYKIIPTKFRPYKLMVLTGIRNNYNKKKYCVLYYYKI